MSLKIPRVPDAFELFIAYLCLVGGLPLAIGAPPPDAIQRLLPGLLVQGWGITLAIGGLLVVVGVPMRSRSHSAATRLIAGLRIEQAGLVPLGAASVVFATATVAVAGWRGVFPAGTYLAFTAACASRAAEARYAELAFRKWMGGS